jgi:molybdopterin molybdotransferase
MQTPTDVQAAPRAARRLDHRPGGSRELVELEDARRWLEARTPPLAAEWIPAAEAVGRVLAAPPSPPRLASPGNALAAMDGYAIRSHDTDGAAEGSPIRLPLQRAPGPLAPRAAALVAAGAQLPAGADAVLPFHGAELAADELTITLAIPEQAGVLRHDRELKAFEAIAGTARPLRPLDVALLSALGAGPLEAIRRPRVRLVVAGPKSAAGVPDALDSDGPMLRALLLRDGGLIGNRITGAEDRAALAAALGAVDQADVILVAGRSGTGPDDDAPRALADVGELAIHGIGLRPGGTAGLGMVGGTPVVLLPGEPLACIAAYELVAGPLVRRLGGRDPALPHRTVTAEVARPIGSTRDLVEWCNVALRDGKVEPCAEAEDLSLAGAIRADGFVIVPAGCAAHANGARVTVHLFD